MWIKRLGQVLGVFWLLYAADLLIRETVSVISGPLLFKPHLLVLVHVAVITFVGFLLVRSLKGRALISVVATLYVGFGYFVFLSNTWFEATVDTWFAIAVVVLTIFTVLHALLVWISGPKVHNTA